MVFLASTILLFGLFMVVGGVRIIRDKKFWSVVRTIPSPGLHRRLALPEVVAGKNAIRSGSGYIVYGIVIMLLSAGLFYLIIFVK